MPGEMVLSVMLVLGRLRQEACHDSEASMAYITSTRPVRGT